MSRIDDARELERLQFGKLMNQLASIRTERLASIKADFARRNMLSSGPRFYAEFMAQADFIEGLAKGRIEIRRDILTFCPELGSDAELALLKTKINSDVDAYLLNIKPQHPLGDGMLASLAPTLGRQKEQTATGIKIRAVNEISILSKEVALKIPNQKAGNPTVTINSSGSSVLVNLGQISGSVRQVIGTLSEANQQELAGHLEQLAAAIEAVAESAEDRAMFLDQVRIVAEQAAIAPEDRNPVRVRGALKSLASSVLQHSANVAQILSVLGPIAGHYFGFKWI